MLTLRMAAEMVRQSPLPSFLCDTYRTVVRTNGAFLDIIGLGEGEAVGNAWTHRIHSDDRTRIERAWRTARAANQAFNERMRFKNARTGLVTWASVASAPLIDEYGREFGFLGHCVDLSAFVESEQSSLERAQLLEVADGLLGVGHWRVRGADQRVLWSRRVHEMHGTDPEHYVPSVKDGLDFYHPDDQPRIANAVAEALVHDRPYDLELRLIRTDGQVRWVRTVGRPVKALDTAGKETTDIVGTFVDVTATREALYDLAESEERYALAIQANGEGVWDWNTKTDELYWTDRFLELMGLERAQFSGAIGEFTERLHPDDSASTLEAVQAHFKERNPYDVRYRLRRQDGNYVWLRAKGRASFDDGGNPTRMVGTVSDLGTGELANVVPFRRGVAS